MTEETINIAVSVFFSCWKPYVNFSQTLRGVDHLGQILSNVHYDVNLFKTTIRDFESL